MGQQPRTLDPHASPLAYFGAELRAWRGRRGLSQAQLGQLVHVSGDLLGKVEKAQRRPLPDLIRRLDTALGADGQLARVAESLNGSSLVPEGRGRPARHAARRGEDGRTRGSEARVMAAAQAWLAEASVHRVDDVALSSEPSDPAVALLKDRVRQLRRMDDTRGGPTVLDWTLHELRWAQELNRRGGGSDPRLLGVVGELAQLGGWLSCDSGDHTRAENLWLLALGASRTGGDPRLGATVLSCLSYQALWTDRPRQALDLIEVARRGSRGLPGGALQALLATREARVQARLGRRSRCESALEDARVAFASRDQDRDPDWVYWVSSAVLAADAGRAHLELGLARDAAADLSAGLELFGTSQPRNRALHLTSLAQAQLMAGEVERAAMTTDAALALATATESRRITERLRSLLGSFAAVPAPVARETADRVRAVLAA
jgi:transcriptional regulator with XRE-family HTH domain